MYEPRAGRRASLHALALAVAALAAVAAQAASDCFEPLRAAPGWSCHADLSNGQAVDFCLERANVFGTDPASRFFKTVSTGPYASSCSCRARGKLPGAAFGEDSTYLCLDRGTDTVISGKITKQRIAGQTFNVSANLRGSFGCVPDPACDVPTVVDPDLTAESGALPLRTSEAVRVDLIAAGEVAVGYLPGCGGYASEAPTFVFRVESSPVGSLQFRFGKTPAETDSAGILVVTPSGAAQCGATTVSLPTQPGSYGVWVRAQTPGSPVEGSLEGLHLVQ